MSNGARLLLLGLLWPLLWLQGRHVRRTAPRMPEPPGHRAGTAGCGSLMRLLVAGDSGAAGVGAASQDQALCGQLVRRLSVHHTVQWCVLAVNGLDSPGLLKLLQDSPSARYDVVVLSMGANDATALCAPMQWAQWQNSLAELIADRFAPNLLVHSAVPPMHACKALPQPLRWFMGRWARQMNTALERELADQDRRTLHWHPKTTTSDGMALDGMHPSSDGYSVWADGLSRHILDAHSPSRNHHANTGMTGGGCVSNVTQPLTAMPGVGTVGQVPSFARRWQTPAHALSLDHVRHDFEDPQRSQA